MDNESGIYFDIVAWFLSNLNELNCNKKAETLQKFMVCWKLIWVKGAKKVTQWY